MVNLMKAFEDLDINDFVRKYTNKSVEIKEPAAVSYTHLDVYKRQL